MRTSLPILTGALALALPWRAPGQVPPDAGEPPAAPAAPAASAEPPAPADAPAPAAPAPRLPILGYQIAGAHIDPPERIEVFLVAAVPLGSAFVESGSADGTGAPIGTIPRLRQALAEVGYSAVVTPRPEAGGVRIHVHLRPYDRVRHIFVSGNWPVRQDEIQRRISVRPGQALELPGPERDDEIERERGRIVDFLRGQGYLEANARIDLRQRGVAPAAVDLLVDVDLGPGFPIGPIQVTGNHALSADEVAVGFRHRDLKMAFVPWRWQRPWPSPLPFQTKQLREDLAEITRRYRREGYPSTRVTSDFNPTTSIDHQRKQVRLGLTINEHRHVSVEFEGNEHRPASVLRERITMFERGAMDDHEVAASADAIQHHYQESGYFLARVSWRRTRLGAEADRVVFSVNEGPRLRVRGVEFSGNRAFRAADLAKVVTVRPFPLLGYVGLGTGGHATGRQIELDAERLVEHYRRHGFLDAKARGEAATSPQALGLPGAVAAAAETVSRDEKALFIRYVVDEGALVSVADVRFEAAAGQRLPEEHELYRRSLRLRPGEPYRSELLAEDQNRLARLLGDAGYPAASVEPDADREGSQVVVTWRVDPRARTRVGPIFIRGNFLTRRANILEQIPIASGDLHTTTGFERGQRNLELLQLFNSVKITFPGKEQKREVVPMVVTVEERHDHYGIVRLGVGASTEQAPPDSSIPIGVYGRGEYEHRNLFGRGWNFLAQAALGNSVTRASAGFQDRRFMGTLFRLELTGNYLSQATVRLGDIRSGGGSIGFAREMAPGVDAAFHYNLRNTTRTEFLLRRAGPDEGQPTVQLGTTVGSLSLSAEWLRLDNRLVPSRGFKLDGSVELALPGLSFGIGADTFIKVSGRSTTVVPLLPWLSLRHGLRYDQGFPLRGAAVLPKVERYFAGGDTTIRGFDLDRARAEVIRFPIAPGIDSVQFRPLGGSLRLIQNVDLQVPLAPPLYGALFLDNGVVADSFQGMALADFRHGGGLGFLVKLPIGDIQFAWGWPIDPKPGDSRRGRFHVNIGLMF